MTWDDVKGVWFGSKPWYDYKDKKNIVIYQDGIVSYWQEEIVKISFELFEDIAKGHFKVEDVKAGQRYKLGPFIVVVSEVELFSRSIAVKLVGFDLWAETMRKV